MKLNIYVKKTKIAYNYNFDHKNNRYSINI